jgi:HD-GYP domain-containing protein (c-di-GMP phosphodiesterase class II)
MTAPLRAPDLLTLLLELGQAFHSTLELDPLLDVILRQTAQIAACGGVSIWLHDPPARSVRCTHAIGTNARPLIGSSLPLALFQQAGLYPAGPPLRVDTLVPDAPGGQSLPGALAALAHNMVAAPLVARGAWLGALIVVNKAGRPVFGQTDTKLVGALAGHAAVAIQNASLYEQQARHARRQNLLAQISQHFQQTLDLEALMPLVLDKVAQALGAEAQSLWLVDPASGQIVCRFATGPGSEAIKRVQVPPGQGIIGTSVAERRPIISADAQHDPRRFHGADATTGLTTRSLVCAPLVRQGTSIGAIEAVNKRTGRPFDRDDLDLLLRLADSAAPAIENARLFNQLAASYDSTLDALAAALDLRDHETAGHSRRVVEYTACLAEQIGLDKAAIAEIRRGALIHDIGKIGVPDAILHKPGSLDPHERRIIERHPRVGYEMLLDIPYLRDEISIVLAHHEHWDGTGYPLGLAGEAIPLAARLFAVADAYDALTSDRPYRQGRRYDEARAIITAESGTQFDPAAVSAFLAVPAERWHAIREQVLREVAEREAEQRERARSGATGHIADDEP